MRSKDLLSVSLCVNDPDNGNPTGHVESVHIDVEGETIELAGCYLYMRDNPRCSIDQKRKRVSIGRRRYPFVGYRAWYGNWCWDAVGMTWRDARALVAYLLERGFMVEGGPIRCSLYPKGVWPERAEHKASA